MVESSPSLTYFSFSEDDELEVIEALDYEDIGKLEGDIQMEPEDWTHILADETEATKPESSLPPQSLNISEVVD